ncbi:MAG: MIP family channel protein [Acidobacteria bacterium]|nr:MIP family channel protein [Acidobacteriota bacterium]
MSTATAETASDDTSALSKTSTSAPKKLVTPGLGAALGAEALGTFLLCFAGLGTALWAGGSAAGTLPVGLGFGLALLAGIVAFGYVSGGHFNPAVTLAAALAGSVSWLTALFYVIAQVIAGVFAGLVLFLSLRLFPALTAQGAKQTPTTLMTSLANGFDQHSPSTMPMAGVLLIEVVATAIFVAVILGSSRPKANTVLVPLAIAATLAAVITVALPLSNASINPARSTAVVFFSDPWAAGQLWLFWVAPLLGGALSGLVFRAFVVPADLGTVVVDGSASTLAAPPLAVAEDAADVVVASDIAGTNRGDSANAGAGVKGESPEPLTKPAPAPQRTEAQEFFDNP